MIDRDLICSSHTISGVMPGDPRVSRHSFSARVKACAQAGYKGMCLHFRDYRAQKANGIADELLRRTLQQNDMRHISLEFLVDWFLEGQAGEQSRADERTAYDAARAFEAKSLNIGSDFKGLGIPAKTMRARLRELCERAGERGLAIALEIVPWSDVRDVDTALTLVDGIPNAGLVIDSWHVFRGAIPLADIERIPGEKILCIQVDDAPATFHGALAEDTMRRLPCGEGSFDLKGFIESLNRTGTRVPVSVEIISAAFANLDIDAAARTSFDTTRRVLASVSA